ncbi:ABC transporter transmembrane domain-containing protein [Salinibius halmophilus]|uniref:ABC transporter transmembrane domain-containing protein n=1 Tax=Salinibius halmophilus TaxID=1853216 RepID=UPI000E6758B5|nr:ABC transporter transmembrane domain-containing protein [Salinibius halmophilus]
MRPNVSPELWLHARFTTSLANYIRLNWPKYAMALLALMAVSVVSITLPWLVGKTIDDLKAGEVAAAGLWQRFGFMLMLGLAGYGLRYYWRAKLFGTSYRLSVALRRHLYDRLSKLGPAFFNKHRTGDLMARATNDVDSVEMAAGEAVLAAFDGLLTFTVVLIMMVAIVDWRLAALALIPFPIMTYVFRRIGVRMEQSYKDALEQFSTLNDHTQESLAGLRPMRALGLQGILQRDFDAQAEKTFASNAKVQRIEALYEPLILGSLGFSTLLALAGGSYLIYLDQLTIGQLTSFNLYLGLLIWPMFAFGWFLNVYHRGAAAHVRLYELLVEPDTLPDHGTAPVPSEYSLNIDIAEFRYQPHLPAALKDIQLSVRTGQMIGIVGPTGSGKSTLLRLIQRYYDVQDGRITLAGKPLTEYPLDTLRDVFAMVPQDPILFSDSLAANIRLGKPNASDEEVLAFAQLAELAPDIERLPDGLATTVGEKGVTLSGGQRQRIALARALMRDAPVLCLDDTLSAVDNETERRILQALAGEQGQRSLVVVSHRLSAVQDADLIIVLKDGECAEQGTHEQLMQLEDGWYARMYSHQQLENHLE